MMISEPNVSELKAQHGTRLYQVETCAGNVVYKPPSRGAWDEFQDKVSDTEKSKAAAVRDLAIACVVHPEPALFAQLVEEYPALPGTVAQAIRRTAGAVERAEGKAL